MSLVTPQHCPACGHGGTVTVRTGVRDFEYGAPGEYAWVRCAECALVRLDPFPSAEVLDRAYPPDYHAYVESTSGLTNYLRDRSVRGTARAVRKRLEPGMAVLDVGCSRGRLLGAIGALGDFELHGVEGNAAAAADARSRGVTVFEGWFEEATYAPASFDVILMWHVLEHVADPIETLRTVRRLLRPGGVLLGELPNFRSWDAALFGRYWGGGHAPRHLWHFTPATLTRGMEIAELEQVGTSAPLHPAHFALSLQTLFRRGRTDGKGLTSGRAWYYPFLALALLPIALLQMLFHRAGVMRFEGRAPR